MDRRRRRDPGAVPDDVIGFLIDSTRRVDVTDSRRRPALVRSYRPNASRAITDEPAGQPAETCSGPTKRCPVVTSSANRQSVLLSYQTKPPDGTAVANRLQQ